MDRVISIKCKDKNNVILLRKTQNKGAPNVNLRRPGSVLPLAAYFNP